jgi:LysM repeat protein
MCGPAKQVLHSVIITTPLVIQHCCQLDSMGRLKIPHSWIHRLFYVTITDNTEANVKNTQGVQNSKEYKKKYPVNKEDFSSKIETIQKMCHYKRHIEYKTV